MAPGTPRESPWCPVDSTCSTTMAYHLRAEGYSLIAISFDYGQRQRKELAFATQMAADLDAPWTLIDLHAAGLTSILLTGSALTDETVSGPRQPLRRRDA